VVFSTPNGGVKNIKDVKDGFTYPKTASVMRVSIVSWELFGRLLRLRVSEQLSQDPKLL
jgi:hypothetical protein